MIQAIMLVSLGFLAATLLALIVAPAAWARAVRLTSHRIRSSLPINETEIRAEKDQLRASHAVTVHQLEKKIGRAELSAARQRVELNRRDAEISDLKTAAIDLTASRDENQNARHVLAQTLNERLPRAEERLQETRNLLKARDDQIVKFITSATKQQAALSEARAMLAQQDEDIRRLNAALMARQHAARGQLESQANEQNVALSAEVIELRERTSEQARLIDRIQRKDASERLPQQQMHRHVPSAIFADNEPSSIGERLSEAIPTPRTRSNDSAVTQLGKSGSSALPQPESGHPSPRNGRLVDRAGAATGATTKIARIADEPPEPAADTEDKSPDAVPELKERTGLFGQLRKRVTSPRQMTTQQVEVRKKTGHAMSDPSTGRQRASGVSEIRNDAGANEPETSGNLLQRLKGFQKV